MKYCSACAALLEYSIPLGDALPRHHCTSCGTIHYQNPKLVVGTLPVYAGQILMCRRNIEPRFGLWTLPGGFMENGETLEQGAARETWEEAQTRPDILQMLSIISLAQYDQVHVYYLADMRSPEFATTPESSEVKLFDAADIPWDQIAFRTVLATLKHYVAHHEDIGKGLFPVLQTDITPNQQTLLKP